MFPQLFANFVVRQRIFILVAALVITASLSHLAAQIQFESDIDIWFLENDPALVSYNDFLDRFEGDEVIVLGVLGDDLFTPEVLRAVDEVTRQGASVPSIHKVRSIANIKVPVVREDDMRVDYLLEAMPESREEAKQARDIVMGNPLVRGKLVSDDGKALSIVFEFAGTGNDFEQKVACVDAIDAIVAGKFPESTSIVLAGSPVFDRAFYDYSKSDFSVMGPVAFLVVLLATFLMFRRLVATILPVTIVLMTVCWLFGLMSFFGLRVNMISTGLMTLSIAVGVADSVHILSEFYHQLRCGRNREEAAHFSVKHLVVPCFFTSITTAGGFLALMAGDLAPISEFGWLSALAVFFAFGLSVTVLPAALVMLPVPKSSELAQEKGRGLEGVLLRASNLDPGRSRWIMALSGMLIVGAFYGVTQIRAESNPINYFKPEDPVRQDMVLVDDVLGGSASVEFLIKTEEEGLKDPEILKRLAILRDGVLKVAGFTQVFSPLESLEEAHRVFADGEGIPEQRDMIAQLFLILEGEKEEFEAYVQGNYSVGRLSGRARFDLDVPILERKRQLQKVIDEEVLVPGLEVEMTGFVKLMTDMEVYLFQGQIQSFLLAFFVISLVLFILLRSLSLGALALLPNLTPVAFGLAFMTVADINLDPGTVMIGPIALGLVVDDTVHFLYRYRVLRGEGMTVPQACQGTIMSAGKAIVTTSLILAAGFSVLALGSFIPNIFFGLVTSVVVLVAMVADLILLPAVLMVFQPASERTAEATTAA